MHCVYLTIYRGNKLPPFYIGKSSREHRQRISLAHRGKSKPKEQIEKMKAALSVLNSGENNHFFGKTHSEETKKIIKEKRAKQITSEATRKKMSESHKKRWTALREGIK
jgi:hypothetical protein